MQRAIVIMFIAMSLIPAGDSAGKIMTSQLGVAPVFVAWSRFAFGTFLLLPFVPPDTLRLFRNWRIWLRAAMLCGGITSIQTALQTEEVANVFAAFFIGPLLSYTLAAIWNISYHVAMAVALGTAAIPVLQPAFDQRPSSLAVGAFTFA